MPQSRWPLQRRPKILRTLTFLQAPGRLTSGLLACLPLAIPTRLDAIVGAGALRVGLTEDYRPFSFADASGKVEGLDVDMSVALRGPLASSSKS